VELPLSDPKKARPNPMRFVNTVEPEFDPISAALRQMHEGVAQEAVPDEFLKLLDQLDAKMSDKEKKPS
jgi:hypothetical protein